MHACIVADTDGQAIADSVHGTSAAGVTASRTGPVRVSSLSTSDVSKVTDAGDVPNDSELMVWHGTAGLHAATPLQLAAKTAATCGELSRMATVRTSPVTGPWVLPVFAEIVVVRLVLSPASLPGMRNGELMVPEAPECALA
jgi:hypothetical protein